MTIKNGYVPSSQLVQVEKGVFLNAPTANAYRRAKALFNDFGSALTTAGPGAGYRSYEVQSEFYKAGHGNKALAAKWNISSSSTVSIAQPGYSSHGLGDRVDLLFRGNGHPTAYQLEIMALFGFTREFGANDPNHFRHQGERGTNPVSRAFLSAHRLFVA